MTRRLLLCLLPFALLTPSINLQAAIIMTFFEDGDDVILEMTGSANLTDLTYFTTSPIFTSVRQIAGINILYAGEIPGTVDAYTGINQPSLFMTGENPGFSADSGTANFYGLEANALGVPTGYTSGDDLGLARSVFNDTTIEDMGLVPGEYVWTWGSGANSDSATLTIVPEPSSSALILAFLTLGFVCRRRRPSINC